ncbi:hypothetical protein T261_0117 [Streptomyces lydicus]|nr:hypothetical protein T261_0117 [Streptomyces lydicus]
MVWEPGEEAWEAKLAALRSYRRTAPGTSPRSPQSNEWLESVAKTLAT